MVRPFLTGLALAVACLSLADAAAAQAPTPAAAAKSSGGEQGSTAACDSACVRTNADRAVQNCAPRIEAEAPGDFDWIIRPYGSIFQEADTPKQAAPNVILYRGDSIRFLSPYEKWARIVYECGFDFTVGRVAFVHTRLGVLGKAGAIPSLPKTPAGQAGARQTPPTPTPQAQAAPNATQSATLDLRKVGEPSEVDVRQIPPGAKPPRPATTAPATGQ